MLLKNGTAFAAVSRKIANFVDMKQKSGLGQTQQQAMGQHLSPQQVRFVHLLEMSGPEIEEAVRAELDENPALEATDSTFGGEDGEDGFSESAEQIQAADYNSEDETPTYLLQAANRGRDDMSDFNFDRNQHWMSLDEWLNDQLNMVEAPARDVAFARYIVGNLDVNGRLTRSLKEIADDITIATGRDVSRADLLAAMEIIRNELDPAGVGAVDLRDCLLIQLRRRQPKTLAIRAAVEIIDNNFDLFSKKHFDRLQAALGVSKETLDDALAVIRTLDPKPGSSLNDASENRAAHITPDFLVTSVEGDETRFSVALNQHLPELAVEKSFLVNHDDASAQMFVRRKRDEANTFKDLIRRRSDTLLSVMQAIVDIQHRFFETENMAEIRPMILKDVAARTGLDQSVVSRATSNKYVATPSGVYPLKMFFSDNPTEDSSASTAEIVAGLVELIEGEDKRHPLSDQALTEALNAKGYHLARRTVAKYREKANIPVARLRKEY